MHYQYRQYFNRSFSTDLCGSYQDEVSRRLKSRFEFRLAETPVFLPDDLRNRLCQAAREILAQLGEKTRLDLMKAAIPPKWNTPGMDALPSFTQIDFAIVRTSGGLLEPRLIELQGFPSLTAMQVIQRDVWNETLQKMPGLEGSWSCWFSGMDRKRFLELARSTILGTHDPEQVILMDLNPRTQKTWPDFYATRLLFGIEAVCPTQLIKSVRKLYRRGQDGVLIPVRRIYHRVVFDELIQKQIQLPFEYCEELDVEWTPHPNWFWAWSKYSLPFLDHPAVPRAILLSDLPRLPHDLSGYVLKPLYSFAGGGVNVTPKLEDIESIPFKERHAWCLQKKIVYEPALRAIDGGGVKVEVRMMFLKPDNEAQPILAQNLCRLSRGAMMGVDFNKNFTWVGSSVGLWRE
jgi:hypothetical protein